MIRHFTELAFRSEQAREWLDGAPQIRDVLVTIMVQYASDVARKSYAIHMIMTVDWRLCPDLCRIMRATFIDPLVQQASDDIDAVTKLMQGLLLVKNELTSKAFDLPSMWRTQQEFDGKFLGSMMRMKR
jgi:hypothetical protein